jgi:hypothetical protein
LRRAHRLSADFIAGWWARFALPTVRTENDPTCIPEVVIEAGSPDHKRAILFVTKADKIRSMATGMKPMVLEAEHCIWRLRRARSRALT